MSRVAEWLKQAGLSQVQQNRCRNYPERLYLHLIPYAQKANLLTFPTHITKTLKSGLIAPCHILFRFKFPLARP
jgi:hypothetical protein